MGRVVKGGGLMMCSLLVVWLMGYWVFPGERLRYGGGGCQVGCCVVVGGTCLCCVEPSSVEVLKGRI